MRETTLLAIAAASALVGLVLGHLVFAKKPALVAVKIVESVPEVPALSLAKPIPRMETEPIDSESAPEAIQAWRRQDKDAIERRVAALTNAEAEQLCFLLQLIPRDEVFDHINVKGRLSRHIDDMRIAAEFSDVEMAFRELNDRH